jgi:hypothetical protein
MFRLWVDANVIAEALTAVQAHLLVGEILDRVALPKPDESDERRRQPRHVADRQGKEKFRSSRLQ